MTLAMVSLNVCEIFYAFMTPTNLHTISPILQTMPLALRFTTRLLLTENVVQSLEARVNNSRVWIRVEAVSATPAVTDLVVQARADNDTGNQVLANQLSTEIAIQLEHAH
jgi:hypothetical protein